MSAPLRQVAIHTTPEAEEAVRMLMQRVFDTEASVFTREDQNRAVVSVYLPQNETVTAAQRKVIAEGMSALAECGIPIGEGQLINKKLARDDWVDSWKRHFKPIDIAGKLLIKPEWRKEVPALGQEVVVLDPGLSFGTGHHATTKYCLRQLVTVHGIKPNASLLDVGTGSGILAIAAAKLGFARIAAFDFDTVAVEVATKNAKRNGVARKVKPEFGDIAKLPVATNSQFDLVCANLTENILIESSDRLIARVKPGGALVIAGVLDTQFDQVQAAFERQGMKRRRSARSGEWRSGVFVHA